MAITEKKVRQIIKEEVRRLSEAWTDDETPQTGMSSEAGMFLEAHPDWREEVEDLYDPETEGEYLAGVMDLVRNFAISHDQPWARSRRTLRAVVADLDANG